MDTEGFAAANAGGPWDGRQGRISRQKERTNRHTRVGQDRGYPTLPLAILGGNTEIWQWLPDSAILGAIQKYDSGYLLPLELEVNQFQLHHTAFFPPKFVQVDIFFNKDK